MIKMKYSESLTLEFKVLSDYPEYANGTEKFQWGVEAGQRDALLYGLTYPPAHYNLTTEYGKGYLFGMTVVYPANRLETLERWKRIGRSQAHRKVNHDR